MGFMMTAIDETGERPGSVEFFGVRLKVNNPHLAALLNSSVSDNVQVIGWRARDAFAASRRVAYMNDHHRPLSADGSTVRVITEEVGQEE